MADSSNTVRLHRVLRARPSEFSRPFSTRTPCADGCPRTAIWGKSIASTRGWGAAITCPSPTLERGTATRSRASSWSCVPGERIRIADKFDDPGLAADMTKTITLASGELRDRDDNPAMRACPRPSRRKCATLGWQESLLQLARLVEPEIPGGE